MIHRPRRRGAHFLVEWNGADLSFGEVTGLSATGTPSITLKRGLLHSPGRLAPWLAPFARHASARDVIVRLVSESSVVTAAWVIRRAFPVKVDGPSLNGRGNDVAIDSIELSHEGIEVLPHDDW
jgi:phage tail-like protein